MKLHPRLACVLLLLPALVASPAPAQPPGKANPLAPTLQPVVPSGAQRGTTLELTLTGTNLAEPTGVWTSFPAKITIPADGGNGKDKAKLRVKLEVPKDAPLGFHGLRLATRQGVSNARLFCVDDLPQVLEVATNKALKTAQALTAPCVVVGKADKESTDYYKVTAKAGQRLSFEVLGRRLGSAFDPQLTLLDAAGNELPGGHSNDAPGLQTDPRLTYTFKTAGDYYVAVRDVSYQGGDDFHYRLRVGDFPCATTPLPLAAKRGGKASVRFAGPHVDGVAAVEVAVPDDPTAQALQVAPKGASGLHGWPVTLAVSDLDEGLEKEPNGEAAKANRVPVPGAVTARFEEKDDLDYFVFAGKKGQRLVLEAHTSEHLSPTEVYLVLRDGKGKQLQASNPMLPPRLDFTAPADGDYTLAVEHLHSWGGPDEVYRLTVTPYVPSFSLALNLDRFEVTPGGAASVPVFLTRAGYAGAVEVSVVGPKGLSGTLTIPAGPPAPPKPPTAPAGVLTLKAADDLPAGPLVFLVQGKATVDGKEVVAFASVRAAVAAGLANLAVPPRAMFTQVGLAVKDKPPFALAAKLDAADAAPGKTVTVSVTVTRSAGFAGEVALSAAGLPPGVTAAPAKVAAGEDKATLTLTLAATAKPGAYPVTVQGKGRHGERDFVVGAGVRLVVKK